METRIPNFLVTYNYFSVEHSQKTSVRDRNPPNKEKASTEPFLVFTGTCVKAGDATLRLGQFPRFEWTKDRYRISIRSIKTRAELLLVKKDAVTHVP